MTKEEKIAKKIARAKARKQKRDQKYKELLYKAKLDDVPLSAIKRPGSSWWDDSRNCYMQVCSYYGKCEYPCNGDC